MEIQRFLSLLHTYAERAAQKGKKERSAYWEKCIRKLMRYDAAVASDLEKAGRLGPYRFNRMANKLISEFQAALHSDLSESPKLVNGLSTPEAPLLFEPTVDHPLIHANALQYGESLLRHSQWLDTMYTIGRWEAGDFTEEDGYLPSAVLGTIGFRYILYGLSTGHTEMHDKMPTVWCPLCFRRVAYRLRQQHYCDVHSLGDIENNRAAHNRAKRIAARAPDKLKSIRFFQRNIDKAMAEAIHRSGDHRIGVMWIPEWRDWLLNRLLVQNPKVARLVQGVEKKKVWNSALQFIYNRLRHPEDSQSMEVLKMTVNAAEIWLALEEVFSNPRGQTKQRIAELAMMGYTKSKIAAELKISLSAVSQAVRRNSSLQALFE